MKYVNDETKNLPGDEALKFRSINSKANQIYKARGHASPSASAAILSSSTCTIFFHRSFTSAYSSHEKRLESISGSRSVRGHVLAVIPHHLGAERFQRSGGNAFPEDNDLYVRQQAFQCIGQKGCASSSYLQSVEIPTTVTK